MESIIEELEPFLRGGHIKLTHKVGKRSFVTARGLERYEYDYFMEDLKKAIKPHIDFERGKVWIEESKIHKERR